MTKKEMRTGAEETRGVPETLETLKTEKNEPTLLVTKQNSILYVDLNRPHLHNALNPSMIAALTEVFTHVDKSCHALVLQGRGPSFSAGADLNWMKSMVNYKFEENVADSCQLFEMFEAGLHCPCPIVGKLHGYVMGGALGLVAICDIAFAESKTRFCFSEVKLGLAPAVISPFVFNKVGCSSIVSSWMLTGQFFGPSEAKESRLIHGVGSLKEVDEMVQKTLDRFLSSGLEAVRATKKLTNGCLSHYSGKSWGDIKGEVTRTIAERRVSVEGQRGLQSFLKKQSSGREKRGSGV